MMDRKHQKRPKQQSKVFFLCITQITMHLVCSDFTTFVLLQQHNVIKYQLGYELFAEKSRQISALSSMIQKDI